MKTLKAQLSSALKERMEGKEVARTAREVGMSKDALHRLMKDDLPSVTNLSDQLECLGLEVTITVKQGG